MKLSTFNYILAIYSAVVAVWLSFFSETDSSYMWAWVEIGIAAATLWFANFLFKRDL